MLLQVNPVKHYKSMLEKALNTLYGGLKRTIVQIVSPMHVEMLRQLAAEKSWCKVVYGFVS